MTGGGELTLDHVGLVITAAVNAPQLEQRRSPARPLGRLFLKVPLRELWGGTSRGKNLAQAISGHFAPSVHVADLRLGRFEAELLGFPLSQN